MKKIAIMFSSFLSLFVFVIFALLSQVAVAIDVDILSRIDLLEQRIEALEQLVRSQRSMLEESAQQRVLQKDCVPKRNKDNVCVYDDGLEFYFPNANLIFNSSIVRFTGPILEVNVTDSQGNVTDAITQEFSSHVIFDSTSIGVSGSNITIEDSNTTFTTNSSSGNDDSTIVFNHTKIFYNHTDAEMVGSSTSASDSSVSYGKNTNVKWSGDSASAYFSNGAGLTVYKSNVEFDNTYFEQKGTSGRTISRVSTQFRGPTSGDPIGVLFTRRVNVRFEQSETMDIQTNVELWGNHKLVVDDGSSLVVNGKLASNYETEFAGDILMKDVSIDIDGQLVIDREDDYENADIEFRNGVDVRFYNDVRMDEDLNVHGHAEIDTLEVSEEVTIKGRLYCRKGATISGDSSSSSYETSMYSTKLLKVEGSALLTRDLEVERNVEVHDDLDVHGTAKLRNLHVTGSSKLYSLTVSGGSTYVGTFKATSGTFTGHLDAKSLQVTNGANIGGDLGVVGETVLDKTVFVNVTIQGDADIGGDLTVNGSATVGNAFGVTNDANFGGDVTITGALIAATTTFGSTNFVDITITGNANVGGSLAAGSADISGALDVDGATTLGALTAATTTFGSTNFVDISITGNANVGGALTAAFASVAGPLNANSAVISGSVSVGTDLVVTGNANIDGTASVEELNVNADGSIGGLITADFGSFDSISTLFGEVIGPHGFNVTNDVTIGGTLTVDGVCVTT